MSTEGRISAMRRGSELVVVGMRSWLACQTINRGYSVMGTNLRRSKAVTDSVADDLTEQFLKGRESLPPAANNKAPRPKDKTVAYQRNAMSGGTCRPFHILLAMAEDDITAGVPAPLTLAVFRQLLTEVELIAVKQYERTQVRPLPVVFRTETKAQSLLDLAQLKAVESPTDVTALSDVLARVAQYKTALNEVEATCSRQLAESRGQRVYGTRRPLELRA